MTQLKKVLSFENARQTTELHELKTEKEKNATSICQLQEKVQSLTLELTSVRIFGQHNHFVHRNSGHNNHQRSRNSRGRYI